MSQCPPYLVVDSQEELDSFLINYPNCTKLDSIVIEKCTNVKNLDALVNLDTINGPLHIKSWISDFSGLNNLKHVDGDLRIEGIIGLIDAFNELESVKGDLIFYGYNNCFGDIFFVTLKIIGFEKLKKVGGRLTITGNFYDEIIGFDSLTQVEKDFFISGSQFLKVLDGFQELDTVNGAFIIGVIALYDFDTMTTCFTKLHHVEDEFHLSHPGLLPVGKNFKNLKSTGDFFLKKVNFDDTLSFNTLDTVHGFFVIEDSDDWTAANFESLEFIGNSCRINRNGSLTSMPKFSHLQNIGSDLEITNNPLLTSINGINEIKTLNNLKISENPLLDSLNGFISLDISDTLEIKNCDNFSSCDVSVICNQIINQKTFIYEGPSTMCGDKDSIYYYCTGTSADTIESVFSILPVDITIECIFELPGDQGVTAIDSCGEDLEVYYEQSVIGNCPGNDTITNTWTVTDCEETIITHVQTVIIDDKTRPEFSEKPMDITIECILDLPGDQGITATDNCGEDLVVNYEQSTISDCTEKDVITNTWTVTDCAGNTSSHVQKVTLDDFSPEFSGLPSNFISIECIADLPGDPGVTATDNCGEELEVEYEQSAIGDCPGRDVITNTWTVTDCAGNICAHVQKVIINDFTAPEFSEEPADITIENILDLPVDPGVTAMDNCGEDLEVDYEQSAIKDYLEEGIITNTWTVTDCAENTSTHVQIVTLDDVTDINNLNLNEVISYPNPTFKYLNFTSKSIIDGSVIILNQLGEKVYEQKGFDKIDLDLLNAGLFYVIIKDQDSKIIQVDRILYINQ